MGHARPALVVLAATVIVLALSDGPAVAFPFSFSTGNPDGKMAMASRPGSSGVVEIEAADDFVVGDHTSLTSATFIGLVPSGSTIARVIVEVYRVFPVDSNTGRTIQVPTRVNSPSDVAFATRDSAAANLSFSTSVLSASFAAANSVLNGINKKPNNITGGEGAVSGQEVQFNVTFKTPLDLPADHYFFIPQVQLNTGNFYWLSAPKPIVSPGTPFSSDLQAWIRNANLDPDWLRVGTDIVGGATPPTFNASFSLTGDALCPISVSPTSLPDAVVGQPYSASFAGSGGTAPYSFSQAGALPTGISLASNGTLAGTPQQAGTFPFTVTAVDSRASPCTGTQNLTLKVASAPPPAPAPTPSISSARLSSTTFRAANRGASLTRRRRPPVGTNVSYRDSQAAKTTFTVLKPVTGHRKARKCVAGRPRKHQKRCTSYVSVGSFTHQDQAGSVRVHFTGRVRGRKLSPGHYRLTLTPKADGKTGRTATLSFRIIK